MLTCKMKIPVNLLYIEFSKFGCNINNLIFLMPTNNFSRPFVEKVPKPVIVNDEGIFVNK